MRSLVHTEFGEPAEVLKVIERPLLEPGPGQVRVRTRLAAIHNHDLATIKGRYGYKPALPAVGGTEAVGTVDAVGEGVSLQVGQRVSAFGTPGLWSEYFLIGAENAVALPDGVSDEVGAQLLAMPISALMLLNQLNPAPGAWIIQNAANGAVGVTLATMAKTRDVPVLSLVRRAGGVEEMAREGIANVIATDAPDWKDRARALVGSAPVAAAIDSVGGEAANDLLDLLSPGGELIAFGAMAGQPLVLSGGTLIAKSVVARGFWASQVRQQMSASERSALIGELIDLALGGKLTLPVGGIYPFDDIATAVEASGRPGRGGKILLQPQGAS